MQNRPVAPRRIYFDHAATTPVREEALEAMRPFLSERFGNASSLHEEGKAAREALEASRETIRRACGASELDLVFCSGGTEADNAALAGVVLAKRREAGDRRLSHRFHVVTSAVEHPAVLNALPFLEELGASVSLVRVDRDGRVDPAAVESELRRETVLVSLMTANNETGALQPIDDVGRIAKERGALMHTDAVQALGKLPLRLDERPVDLATISSHKVHGPKGIAGLFVRKGTPFAPLLRGGAQEGGLRPGTENVAAAVGFARAVELAEAEREATMARLARLRDSILAGIRRVFPGALINTCTARALPTILNVSFPWIEGESLVRLLDWMGVAASTGSACNVGSKKPSHVLHAMGRGDREVRGSLRISLGKMNEECDVEPFVLALERAVRQLEGIAPATV